MLPVPPITQYRITGHARFEMRRRGITESELAHVLSRPDQAEIVRPGRAVVQSRAQVGDPPRIYLMRVFVDVDRQPAEVVTAYRTSRIDRYWRIES